MLAKNSTPFAAIGFEQAHRDGDRMAVIAVRARYELSQEGSLALAPEQALVLADEYESNPHESQMLRVGDLVPFRPNADITVIGSSHAPGSQRSAGWPFGIKTGEHSLALRCNGLRFWEQQATADGVLQWNLGAPEPIDLVPLDYQFAVGGRIIGDPDHGAVGENPRGAGIIHPGLRLYDKPIVAPIIDSEAAPIGDPFTAPEPQGLAPIPPFWPMRQRHAGSYDDAWKQTRHPQLPLDFDYRFYQAAHPGLIYPGYLRGDEQVILANLVPGGGLLPFRLPAIQPYAQFDWTDGRSASARLNLDGLHLDLRHGPPWRVDLTWRAWIVICPRFFKIDLFHTTLVDPALVGMPRSGEEGLFEADGPEIRT